jgi:hypothetical protein
LNIVLQRKTAARRSLRNPIRCFDQAAASAAAFRFLRQPSKPNAPRPEAKSGRAAGSGVVGCTIFGANVFPSEVLDPSRGICAKRK